MVKQSDYTYVITDESIGEQLNDFVTNGEIDENTFSDGPRAVIGSDDFGKFLRRVYLKLFPDSPYDQKFLNRKQFREKIAAFRAQLREYGLKEHRVKFYVDNLAYDLLVKFRICVRDVIMKGLRPL